MPEVVILDFGSQTTHLIKRRLWENGVSAKILPGDIQISKIQNEKPRALILSGGPSSVYGKNALLADKKIYSLNIPILGICYGFEVIVYQLRGKVKKGIKGEYGQAYLSLTDQNSLIFNKTSNYFSVWMSHFDEVAKLPEGFIFTGSTNTIKNACCENLKRKIYCVQFHPEVVHTDYGELILKNFIEKVCLIKTFKDNTNRLRNLIDEKIQNIKFTVGKKQAICAISGGIDSTTSAILTYKAIGKKLHCIFVDTGFMRDGEAEEVEKAFIQLNIPFLKINAQKIFLNKLINIKNPEEKRKIIGETFIRVFENEIKNYPEVKFLVQGTIYPDVIESKGSKHSHIIKTHHNVGGIPKKLKLTIIEPIRDLYKDQVREIAQMLTISSNIIHRQVFPGPGLAVRIIGEVTKEKLETLKKADFIVRNEIYQAGLNDELWMYFAIHTGIQTTGVVGDERRYGDTIAIRALESKDAMTANWARLPYDLLNRISTRITNEIKTVSRVVYDITNKPPGTMEWE